MTLAYVFWHWPHADDPAYADAMRRFHGALGRPGSVTFRLERAPFDAADAPYEDWYPVADWAALGELNDLAVSGARKGPHDAVAARSRSGAGGVFRRIGGDLPLGEAAFAAWTPRRPDPLPAGAVVWQRQLVLGPAPEYAVLAGSPVAVEGAVLTGPRLVATG